MPPDDTLRTISEVAPLVKRGEVLPTHVLGECLARIDRYEPGIRAWAYLDRERAYEDAERLNDELRRGLYRGPLHGIPVGIKDIIDVFDMPTGCGSARWANSYARRDATCVKRLRDAGAIILGKTVTTPFAFLDPPVTRNPWNKDRTPGGSSSGSAAAVACGMCYAALGTQTGGSLTRPAAYCGVFSLKPTHGRVSVDGVLPLATRLDHVGIMANGVRDLGMVFQAIAGPDGRRGFTFEGHATTPDVVAAVDSDGESPDIQVLGGLFDDRLHPAVRPFYEAAVAQMNEKLSVPSRVVPPAGFASVLSAQRTVMAVEAAQYHADRLRRHPDDYPPRIRELIEDGLSRPAVVYADALALMTDLEDQITRMLNGTRFFVTPAATDAAPDPSTTGDAAFNAPWSFTGHPTVSVPYGQTADGLPLSLQVVGSPMCEDDLLRAAAWVDRTLNHRDGSPQLGLPPVR